MAQTLAHELLRSIHKLGNAHGVRFLVENSLRGRFIPVTILHGYQEGPVLSLTAGIHGSEYSPILSMQELPALLDPTKMSGALVIGHCAHRKSDFRGNEFFSPIA
jgi:predicted deacylase